MRSLESVQFSLGRSGWKEYAFMISDCLLDIHTCMKSFCLHLDIGETIKLPPGVELHVADDPLVPDARKLWEPVLHSLAAKGFCLQEKADALIKWPGCSYEGEVPGLVPLLTCRFLYHLKAVFGRDIEFKGYFGFVNRPGTYQLQFPIAGRKQKKTGRTAKQAVEQGINFLYANQLESGEFRTLVSPAPGPFTLSPRLMA